MLAACDFSTRTFLALSSRAAIIGEVPSENGFCFANWRHIASTLWRTVADTKARRYYFESAFSPTIFWVDLANLKLEPGSKPMKLDLSSKPILAGEVSGQFKPAEPFKFLAH